jgi:DNA-binding transcriptional LysR family regulator
MNVRQLEYFVAVADELNFTRAAARCRVAQSALSYQVARLEQEQGVTLFERTSRSVRLAAAGELLLPHARRVLAEIDTARQELAALAGVITGRLRIGMISSTDQAAPAIERALAVFHQRHPAVEIAIQDTGSHRMAEQVRAGELDVAFVGLFADQVPPDLVHRLLAVEPLVAVVDPGHPLASRAHPDPASWSERHSRTHLASDSAVRTAPVAAVGGAERRPRGGAVELGELAAHGPFVEMRAESGLRRQVDAAFARAGADRSIAFELGTSQGLVRFVGLGFGAAIVPRSAAQGADVVVLELADRAARHPISLLHQQPEPSAPAARAFLALLPEAMPTPHS